MADSGDRKGNADILKYNKVPLSDAQIYKNYPRIEKGPIRGYLSCLNRLLMQKEMTERLWTMQVQFSYYIIALAVSCIAFTVYQSMDAKLNWSQLPMWLSVLSWGLCVFSGLHYLKIGMNTTKMNIVWFEQKIAESGDKELRKMVKEMIEKQSTLSNTWSVDCQSFLLLGALFFIEWRIAEMAFII